MRLPSLAFALAGGLMIGVPAAAGAPDASPRPAARPDAAAVVTRAAALPGVVPAPRPRLEAGDPVAMASLVPMPPRVVPRIVPPARPETETETEAAPAAATDPRMPIGAAPSASLVPRARPAEPQAEVVLVAAAAVAPVQLPAAATRLAVASSPRPETRPRPGRRAAPAGSAEATVTPVSAQRTNPLRDLIPRTGKGGLCGVSGLEGDRLAPVVGKVSGCGIEAPIRLRAVNGVTLSQPAMIDCPTALALQDWLESGVKPAVGRTGGGVRELTVFASYACRPRNNQRGARLSEHGKGHAIDIGGLVLKDGTTVTVLDGWKSSSWRPMLASARQAACGPFGTVLGPGSDRFHSNHFHLDTARYRSGAYCR